MRFALLEAKIAIVKALRLTEIQCCEKTQVNANISLLFFTLIYIDSSQTE
jgi:hypothetical protein